MAFMQRHFKSGLGKRWWSWRALADRRGGREPSYVEPDEEPDDPPVGEPEPPIDTPEDPTTEEPEPGVDPDFVEATRIEIADSKQTVIRTEAEPNTWGNAYVGTAADAYDYWEVHIDASTPTNSTLAVGVTNNDLPLNGVPGDLAGTAAYWSTGKVRINAVDTTGFATYGRRDVIMIARDDDTGRIWFGKDGAWLGSTPAVAGSGHQATLTGDGPYYPFVSLYSSGAKITFKFITSKFAYATPTGFFPLGQTPAAAPGQFQPADWSIADDGTGGAATISIATLPADAGALVTVEYQIDGGSWIDMGAAVVGDYPITGLTDDVEVDVAIRGVNAAGAGTASATKAVTPTAPVFPVVESRSNATTAAATTHSITLPTGVTVGDLILIVFTGDGLSTFSISSGTNWNILAQNQHTSGCSAVFYKVADGTDALVVGSTATEEASHIGLRISGASGVVTQSGAVSAANNPDPPNHAPVAGSQRYLWIATVHAGESRDWSVAPSNYTNLTTRQFSAASTAVAQRELEAASENPGVFTSTGFATYYVRTIAVHPAP